MKKQIFAAVLSAAITAGTLPVFAAGGTSYTFKGTVTATEGGTQDVTNARLTDKITVTTSGATNYKCAAITDTAHNKDCGYYPYGDGFKASGAYILLATGNTNDNSVFTLNMPKIPKGSKVTLTFAKPKITNNGSAYRNSGDPYAYFKIADRYISINGDNFDTWRTESVVTGEDTDSIVFTADKWGAVAISKIEIFDAKSTKLYNVTLGSERYAYITVNGIKFFADENGSLPPLTFTDGDTVTVKADKDGYADAEASFTVSGDTTKDIPLECETDAAYYESDFGNSAGVMKLDDNDTFLFGNGIDTREITRLSSNVTFSEGGALSLMSDTSAAVTLEYRDGIYCGSTLITPKNNMEFDIVFDKTLKKAVLIQNGISTVLDASVCPDKLASVSGTNVSLEYIGITYPDMTSLTIDGADTIYAPQSDMASVPYLYGISADYVRPETVITAECQGADGVALTTKMLDRPVQPYDAFPDTDAASSPKSGQLIASLILSPAASGTITLTASYMGGTAQKTITIKNAPALGTAQPADNIPSVLNLNSPQSFAPVLRYADENGVTIYAKPKDFSSSDGRIVAVDKNGALSALAKGTASVTVNSFTGADNTASFPVTADRYYIEGVTEASPVTYALNDFTENENIISYTLNLENEAPKEIEPTEIPAAAVKEDGTVIEVFYSDSAVASTKRRIVHAGDKVPVSNGAKSVFLSSASGFTELTDADTTVSGFAIEHAPGVRYEIDPVYKFTEIGDVKDEGKQLDGRFPDGLYDITFKKAETRRGDIYVNGFMVGNNVDQADADRRVIEGALYTAEDISIKNGTVTVSMTDGSTLLDYVTVQKKPEFYIRPQRVYAIGDSLVCAYYGDFEQEVGGGRAGWGQQLPNYLNVPVTNLGNSGQYAAGLYKTAFPSVIENGRSGDILLIECAYNDRNYSNRAEMTACVKDMIKQCRMAGITPILVTPNASRHDYKPSVSWSSYLRDIAADTECMLIDLSKESYDFLYSLYGDDKDNTVTVNFNLTAVGGDTLHSSYAGAHKWASVVAQGLEELGFGSIVNTDYKYEFTDTLGNKITAQAK